MSQELQDYIAQARKVGKNEEEIVKELLNTGWKMKDINSVMSQVVPKLPDHAQHKDIFKPVAIRLVAILLLVGYMIIAWLLPESLDSRNEEFFLLTPGYIFFIYIPLILLTLSITSLLKGKGSMPFGLMPSTNFWRMVNKFSAMYLKYYIVLLIISIILNSLIIMLIY